MTKEIDWDSIRDFYKKRKEIFASKYWVYGFSRTKNGELTDLKQRYGENDYYGYTLKPPYSLQEIENYEEKILGKRLPEDLRDYLLLVSREIFVWIYPVTFEIGKIYDPSYIQIGSGGCDFEEVIVIKVQDFGKVQRHQQSDFGPASDGTITEKRHLCDSFLEYLKLGMEDIDRD